MHLWLTKSQQESRLPCEWSLKGVCRRRPTRAFVNRYSQRGRLVKGQRSLSPVQPGPASRPSDRAANPPCRRAWGTTGATVRWSARPARPQHRRGQPGQANLAIPGLRWPTFLGFSPMWEAPVAAVSNIWVG
jgi:hypothetical protein